LCLSVNKRIFKLKSTLLPVFCRFLLDFWWIVCNFAKRFNTLMSNHRLYEYLLILTQNLGRKLHTLGDILNYYLSNLWIALIICFYFYFYVDPWLGEFKTSLPDDEVTETWVRLLHSCRRLRQTWQRPFQTWWGPL
jgi:hypothetical protein